MAESSPNQVQPDGCGERQRHKEPGRIKELEMGVVGRCGRGPIEGRALCVRRYFGTSAMSKKIVMFKVVMFTAFRVTLYLLGTTFA